jgi:hypothetical protein
MPQSITIAAFVFGAVLLLIAIVGGNFKIFAAEVSATTGKFGRVVAGIAGVILIVVGLVGSNSGDRSPTPATTSVERSGSPGDQTGKSALKTAPTVEAEAPNPTEPLAETVVNVSGNWHDATGAVYRVSQRRNSFTFMGSGPNVTVEGHGTVNGPTVESNYVNTYANGTRSTGHCTGTLSADNNLITGSCYDSMFGQGPSILSR